MTADVAGACELAPTCSGLRHAELEAQWDAVTSRMIVQRDPDGTTVYTRAMAKGWDRIDRVVREWAVQLYGDHVGRDGPDLDNLTGELFDHIGREVVAWCEAQDDRHATRAKGAAA